MERPRRSRKSRALSDRQQPKSPTTNENGFPSLQAPIGTFLDKPSSLSTAKQPNHGWKPSFEATRPAPSQETNINNNTVSSTTTKDNGQRNESSGVSSSMGKMGKLQQETSKEADALSSQMSVAEINESKRELEHALSPELVAFLRQRRNKNNDPPTSKSYAAPNTNMTTDSSPAFTVPVPGASVTESVPSREATTATKDLFETKNEDEDDMEGSNQDIISSNGLVDEKNRIEKELLLFQRLASVQNHDDMDAVYRDENYGESGPFFFASKDRDNLTTTATQTNNDTQEEEENFRVACDLLRSTVPRQNLWAARTIRNVLWHHWKKNKNNNKRHAFMIASSSSSSFPYPVTLPVSLRCLLDVNASHRASNGYVLHAYVLQSLYLLARMRVVADHDVDVTDDCYEEHEKNNNNLNDDGYTCHSIYQEWFANDAVPSTPADQCYQSSAKMEPLSVNGRQNAAYASSSSSESARRDGQNFWNDPLWTLLSQMRIIPRLAQLVQNSCTVAPTGALSLIRLPNEGMSALCGILALVAQRSPGAAAAIAQYDNLTANLVAMALAVNQNDDNDDDESTSTTKPMVPLIFTSIANPVVILFSVLARQSFVAAESLESHTEDLLARVLSLKTTTEHGIFRLQRWSLILWRTLLRYGCGRSSLETVLTVTASQRALGFAQWPCHALVLSCLATMLRSSPSSQTSIRWAMNSIEKSCIEYLDESSTKVAGNGASTQPHNVMTLASCLDFLKAVYEYESCLRSTADDHSSPVDGFTEQEGTRIRSVLSVLVRTDFVSRTFAVVLKDFLVPSPSPRECTEGHSLRLEAAMSFFVCTFLSIFQVGGTRGWIVEDERIRILRDMSDLIGAQAQRKPSSAAGWKDDMSSPLFVARRGWRNLTHSLVTDVVMPYWCSNDCSIDYITVWVLLIGLIGRFQTGDEALAQQILQKSSLLPPHEFEASFSDISTMLLRHLNYTSERASQLTHSLKLHQQCFAPEDKNIGTDERLINLSTQSSKSSEMLFPVGTYWLWKVLAGSTEKSASGANKGVSEELLVVVEAACRIILTLEQAASSGECFYSQHLNTGSKLYYVMNLCLQDEAILGYDELMGVVDQLVSIYSDTFNPMAAAGFLRECSLHSSTAGATNKNHEEVEDLTGDERKAKAWLSTAESSPRLKNLSNFSNDLCTAYTQYGAQYGNFFTRCMRTFLLPSFPTTIRCEVVRRLDGLLHLFTIEKDDMGLCHALKPYLRYETCERRYDDSSSSSCTSSNEDDPEWLDSLARLFSKGNGQQRSDLKFVKCLSICCLGRSVAMQRERINSTRNLATFRKRLDGVEEEFAQACIQMALYMVQSTSPPETSMYIQYALKTLSRDFSVGASLKVLDEVVQRISDVLV